MNDKTFAPISFKKKQPKEPSTGYYRVYKNAEEFVRVQAPTAAEALKQSGVTGAYRVEQDSLDLQPVIEGLTDAQQEAKVEAVQETPAAQEPPATQEKQQV